MLVVEGVGLVGAVCSVVVMDVVDVVGVVGSVDGLAVAAGVCVVRGTVPVVEFAGEAVVWASMTGMAIRLAVARTQEARELKRDRGDMSSPLGQNGPLVRCTGSMRRTLIR